MFTAYLCWITGAALVTAGITTDEDPCDMRGTMASYPGLPRWVKFASIYIITLAGVLLWPAFLMSAIRRMW